MFEYHLIQNNTLIAELKEDMLIISNVQDILDLFGNLISENCSRIIIHKENLNDEFFRLKTGLAGDILQKFSNYRVKLAIVGDFSEYESKSLQDFIRESNKGNTIFFLDTVDSAILKLIK